MRVDLVTGRLLVWLVKSVGDAELHSDVHLFFYDRYWRLARHHGEIGRARRAAKLKAKALRHYDLSGQSGPPAAALAAAIPRPPLRTWLVSGRPDYDRAA